MKGMQKSISFPDLKQTPGMLSGMKHVGSTPDFSRRQTLLSIPGTFLARKIITDRIEVSLGSWEKTEQNVAQLMEQWVKIRDNLHILESESSFLVRARIRYAITFYEGIINTSVHVDVLKKLLQHFEDLRLVDSQDIDATLYERMKTDLRYREMLQTP